MIGLAIVSLVLGLLLWSLKRSGAIPDYVQPLLRIAFPALGGFAALFLALACLTVVPAGHVGVPVIFGAVQVRHIPEGLHLVNPFATVEQLSVRTETYTMVSAYSEGQVRGDDSVYALSSDGVVMGMDISVAYKLVDTSAPSIYRHIGRHYADSLVRPAARSAVPEATAHFAFQEAYSGRREQLAAEIKSRTANGIASIVKQYGDIQGPALVVQEVFLRKIELPANLKQAIEQKMQAEQEAQRMQFVLDREKREAERKRIEAQGIRDFQHTVAEGISDKLLQWKGIEATEKLAQSQNAKVVVVGSGKGGLPIILNPAQ